MVKGCREAHRRCPTHQPTRLQMAPSFNLLQSTALNVPSVSCYFRLKEDRRFVNSGGIAECRNTVMCYCHPPVVGWSYRIGLSAALSARVCAHFCPPHGNKKASASSSPGNDNLSGSSPAQDCVNSVLCFLYIDKPTPRKDSPVLVGVLSTALNKGTMSQQIFQDLALASLIDSDDCLGVDSLLALFARTSFPGEISTILSPKPSRIAEAAQNLVWVTQLEKPWTRCIWE